MVRALVVIRLSRVTDATTSPERQLESCQQLCAQRGWDVVALLRIWMCRVQLIPSTASAAQTWHVGWLSRSNHLTLS